LFFNLGGTYNIAKDQKVIINNQKSNIELVSNYSLTYGVGIEYKKINMEIRMNNRMIAGEEDLKAKYKNLSLILGYKIFDTNKK